MIIEKFQLQTLTIGIEQFMGEVRSRMPLLREALVILMKIECISSRQSSRSSGWQSLVSHLMLKKICWESLPAKFPPRQKVRMSHPRAGG